MANIMALDFLQEILGDTYTEDIDKKVSEAIGKSFVARGDFNTVNEAKKSLEAQVATMTTQLEDLKKVDTSKLQEEITRLQGENKSAKEQYENALSKARLDQAVQMALVKAKARDVASVMPHINMGVVKLDGDQLLGLNDQIETIRKEKGYLFEDENNRSKSTGMSHQYGTESNDDDAKAKANNALRQCLGRA